MAHHDHEHHEHEHHEHEHDEHDGDTIETEKPEVDASPHRDEPIGGVGGSPEASGWAGASGGMGASATMGGAGAGGPIGATDPTLTGDDRTVEGGTATEGADPGAVKTEYEMGHEVDPALEPLAESGPRGGSEPEQHPSVADDRGPAEGGD
jgi:hypothetical protein